MAWEILGWLIVAWTALQKAVLLIGEGGNGKSTFLKALIAFIGKRNISTISLHRIEADRFSAARLVGKLANICADLPSRHLEGTSMFKGIVGGDSIVGERKHCESFDFTPYARLVFSANHPPQSTEASAAFFRRWLVIPFGRTFERGGEFEPIPETVLDALFADPGELSGVLNKALDALAGLKARNGFTESTTMKAAWTELRDITDPVAVWLETGTVRGPEGVTGKGDLLTAYNRACASAGRPPSNKTAFGLAVKRLYPDLQDGQRVINGRVTWSWLGIGLRAEGER